MSAEARPDAPRAGFALVAVLAVMALLSSLAFGLSLWSRNAVEAAAVAASDVRMNALLRSGVTIAGYQLFVRKIPGERLTGEQLALDAGRVTITVHDSGGRVDLNGSEPPLLAAAYRAAGLGGMPADTFAARVTDWRDENEAPGDGGGAEAGAYAAAGLPAPRNGPFGTVSDLRWVLGVSESDVMALAPFVSVLNPAGRLDPYRASPALLEQLPGVKRSVVAQAAAIAAARRTPEGDERLGTLLTEQDRFITFDPPLVFQVTVDAVLAAGGREAQVTAALLASTTGDKPFRVAAWEQ